MAWLRDVHNNYINSSAAATGTPVEAKGGRRIELKDAEKRTLGFVFEAELQPHEAAMGGPIACCFISPLDGQVSWGAVAAWRITPNGAEAVIAGTRPIGSTMLLEVSTGALISVDCGRRFADIKEAVAAIRADEKGVIQ